MDTKFHKPQAGMSSLIISVLLILSSINLLSCEQQPQSIFERQANAQSAHDIAFNDNDDGNVNSVAMMASANPTTTDSSNSIKKKNSVATIIQVKKQQAIARQPNCDATRATCQYFELNVLELSPDQPWLTSIMWQTIARVLAPETPLASQDEMAKKTVSMLFNQIEYSEAVVKSLPMYQRIDTELVLNPAVNHSITGQDNSSTKPNSNNIATGYLTIRSKQHRNDSRKQQLTYVMLDMQKKLQLTIDDILVPEVSNKELLLTFQTAKKEWLNLQGIEQQYQEEWPLTVSRQWYLDEQGLHMVYQAGELLTAKTDTVDLIVPYKSLQGVIKLRYIVPPPL